MLHAILEIYEVFFIAIEKWESGEHINSCILLLSPNTHSASH